MIKTTIKIEGMSCGMCEAHINDVIRKHVPGAKKVTSSHKKGITTFLSEGDIPMESIKNAIHETGYTFISAENEPYEKKGRFRKS